MRFHKDPTPEEIKQMTAEIRAGWDERTEQHRNQHTPNPIYLTEASGLGKYSQSRKPKGSDASDY